MNCHILGLSLHAALLLLVLSQFLFQEAQLCVHLIKQLWHWQAYL